MGYLPALNDLNTGRQMISQFGGYNHNPRIADNEFDGMKNMSSSFYPVLSPRQKRGEFHPLTKPNGLAAKTNLFWVDGTTLYHNGVSVPGLVLQDNMKQFVSMGAYLLIWPDKVFYNTADQTFGNLEASITIASTVTCTLTKADGTDYVTPTVGDTAPADPVDGTLWLDTSATTHVLKQYSGASASWVPVATTYVKISAENIGSLFSQYDGVTISGLGTASLNGDVIIQAVSNDYIVIIGILDATATQEGGVTVSRTVPDMDFLTECENRVWGCSSEKHEIYACKLGDPKNWHVFMNLSTDSYAATVGSDGDFTGACTHLGAVLFFKEDYMHKVAGNKPSNYQVSGIACRGVEKGSENSLAVVNERLYYKSRTGICAYDGSIPGEISAPLGDVRYRSGVGGALGNKYYISMADTAGTYHLFVYDTIAGMWHREDNTHAMQFATHEGELIFIDADTKWIRTVRGRLSVHEGGVQYDIENGHVEDDVEWMIETGEIGLDLADHKYVSKFQIRMEIGTPQEIQIAFRYDGSVDWVIQAALAFHALRTISIPIIPRRCEHMRMRISGTGDFKIFSITKTIEESEI